MKNYPHRFARECVLEWDDVRDTFIHVAKGGDYPQGAIVESVSNCRRSSSFYGNTVDEMLTYLHSGFTSPDISDAASMVKEIHTAEILYDEEGENIDVAAALSGDDEPFWTVEDIPTKPGVRLIVELAFLGVTRSHILAQYGAWLGATVANLEGEGIDVELDVELPSAQNLITGDKKSSNTMIIRVKRSGEIREFADYSALFAPGGFRLLGFTARAMACEKWGVHCSYGYGSSLDREWGTIWDAQERTLRITRPAAPDRFPREYLDSELAALL